MLLNLFIISTSLFVFAFIACGHLDRIHDPRVEQLFRKVLWVHFISLIIAVASAFALLGKFVGKMIGDLLF